jgi:hypothetical protein
MTMKRFACTLSLGLSLVASSLMGQSPSMPAFSGRASVPATNNAKGEATKAEPQLEISPGELSPTPEMWFYEQENRRHDDPKHAVRRNAEQENAQRQARLASRQWFGYSNLRPSVDPLPTLGDYSPMWKSNTYFPYQWSTVSDVPIVVWRPDYRVYPLVRY